MNTASLTTSAILQLLDTDQQQDLLQRLQEKTTNYYKQRYELVGKLVEDDIELIECSKGQCMPYFMTYQDYFQYGNDYIPVHCSCGFVSCKEHFDRTEWYHFIDRFADGSNTHHIMCKQCVENDYVDGNPWFLCSDNSENGNGCKCTFEKLQELQNCQ